MNVFVCVLLIGLSVGAALTAPPLPNVTHPPSPPSTAPPLVGGLLPQGKGETIGPFGVSTNGDPFDDGSFDGVRNLSVYMDNIGVTGLRIQYVTKEKFHIREHGSFGSFKADFELEYPEEFITAINGTQSFDITFKTYYVSSIAFATSYGRATDWFGNSTIDSTSFVLESKGDVKKFIGFIGSSSVRINTLGAHFQPQSSTYEGKPNSEVVPPIGGVSGLTFDDGSFDGVRMLIVRESTNCIGFLRIQYVQGNTFQTRDHGSYVEGQNESMVEFEYPEEYITSMIISWSLSSMDPQVATPQVVAIEIVTSYSRKYLLGTLDANSKKYMLKPKSGAGPKLVGVMGTSHDIINSIGARFYKSSSAKTEYALFSVFTFVCVVLALGV